MPSQRDRVHVLHSYHILDTEEDAAFDNLTCIAAQICGTEVALISLVDTDRQWFKSHYGLGMTQTPLRQSICKNLINGEERCLHIREMSELESYQKHPAHTELEFQFYAGFPIKNANGVVLGSFCVLDSKPKELSDVQMDFLQAMADQTMRLIEAHKQSTELERDYLDLQQKSMLIDKGTQIAKLGGFSVNFESQFVFWVEGNNRIFDFPEGFNPSFGELVNPSSSKILSEKKDILKIIQSIVTSAASDEVTSTRDFETNNGSCFHVILQVTKNELFCVIRDQTHFVKIQNELEKSQNLMLEVEGLSKVGGWQINTSSNEVFWTDNTYEIFEVDYGLPLNLELLRGFYQGESRGKMEKSFRHAMETGEGYVAERLILTAKNKNKWIKAKVRPEMKDGVCVRIFGSFQDITEEIKLRRDLKLRKEQALSKANYFQSLVDNQSFFIVKTNLSGFFTFHNELFKERFFQKNESSQSGLLKILNFVSENDRIRCLRLAKACIDDPEDTKRIILVSKSNESESLFVQWEIKAICNAAGEVVELLCMGQDVSELYEKKSELQNLVDVVSSQNKRLVEYTNIISHNVRSHVANLLGLSNLIDLIEDYTEQLPYFILLKQSIQKLDETIIELNSITRIQQQTNLKYDVVNLCQVVEKTKSVLVGDIINSQADIEVNIADDIELRTVPSYLESIVFNLMANAISYRHPERCLELNISAQKTKDGGVMMKFRDNGIGIDKHRHGERIFKLYQTVEKKSGAKGIGLYMVKSQLESLGGKISFESVLDKGSTFILNLKNG